jgi:hypothetical protein
LADSGQNLPPMPLTMLHIHFVPQWFPLSGPGMEETFFDTPPSVIDSGHP